MAIKLTSLFSLKNAASETTKSSKKIQGSLASSISKKRNLYSSIKIFKQRRNELEKRNILSSQLKSPILVQTSGGPRSLSLTNTGKDIGDRLLGFVKYATAGWILSNLPTWIALGKQLTTRIKTASSILSNYGDETLKVLMGITDVFGASIKNISSFDFADNSLRVRTSFEDLMTNVDDLGKGILEAFNVIVKPFTDIPPIGSDQLERERQQQEQGGRRQPQPPSTVSGGNSDFWTLVAVTALEDSDPQGRADVAQSIYNRVAAGVFPGGKNMKNVILAEDGGQYEPVGRAVKQFRQIEDRETAIRAVMAANKISRKSAEKFIDDTASAITNPTLQKNAASYIQNRTDFLGAGIYPDRPSSTELKRRNSGDNIFGNFVGPGSYEYGKRSRSAASTPNFGATSTPSTSPANFLSNLTSPAAAISSFFTGQKPATASTGQRRLQKGDIFTKSLGKGVDYIQIGDLYGSRGGRHGGIDIQAPQGTYIALRVDCEVVAQGDYGNYGLLIDVWVPQYKVQLRMTHLSAILIKSGKIPAGTSFARVGSTGNASGPHIHFEYDTVKGESRGGGAGNPEAYVRLLLLTKSSISGKFSGQTRPSIPLVPTPVVPATTQEEQQAQIDSSYREGLVEGITQERKGRKVIVIDDRNGSVEQRIISTSNGYDSFVEINEFDLLNNFIKNKLLLDLNYL